MMSGLRLALVSLLLAAALPFAACADDAHVENRSRYEAPRATGPMVIDGIGDEAAWSHAEWRPIRFRWLGPEYTAEDFEGRFKIAWTPEKLYLLVEIRDDILFDSHRDPLVQYWDDDCLEIFIDEDFSGGDHQFNHNAFAYHLSLDNRAIDIGTDRQARDYSHHVDSRWRQSANGLTWEVGIEIYDDGYVDESDDNEPLALFAGKILGLMVAYCDNDGSEIRENFIGSESVPFGPKDRGWIDAGLFGQVVLTDAN